MQGLEIGVSIIDIFLAILNFIYLFVIFRFTRSRVSIKDTVTHTSYYFILEAPAHINNDDTNLP